MEHPDPTTSIETPSTLRVLTLLLSRFRAEAQSRSAHGRDFILSCLELAATSVAAFIGRCAGRARHVASEIDEADHLFDEIAADGQVTDDERRRYKARLARPRTEAATLATDLEKAVAG